ncbi:MAG: thiamine phosphate synthase, partial [Muribaculaceae bacterium]|nr:thiamine phosphate synthase [Muribaculaceae bacterium]
TANTFEDIEAVKSLDIDYIGIGPFTDTTTKQNLAPILGISGIAALCDRMKGAEINIPTVAVGGITLDDVKPLLEAGINGVAVSGAIAFADDMTEATRKFCEVLPTGD